MADMLEVVRKADHVIPGERKLDVKKPKSECHDLYMIDMFIIKWNCYYLKINEDREA